MLVATAIRSGPARTSVTSAPPWESPCSPPPRGAQHYNGVVENAFQRSDRIAMASRRAAERRLRAEGVIVCSRLGCSWRQSLGGIGEECRAQAQPGCFPFKPRSRVAAGAVYRQKVCFLGGAVFSVRFHVPGEEVEAGRQGSAATSTRATTMPTAV